VDLTISLCGIFCDVCVKNEEEDIRRQVSWISRKMGKHVFFFFSVVRDKIVYLIFNKGISVPKEYNLRRHYETLHKHKFGILEGKLRQGKLKNLKSDLQRQQNIFTVATKSNEAAVHASFAISQINAKK
jgi:hypothetical protein